MVNRRQTLIGLGLIAGGSGVIAGTGAFTSVEANRSVTVETSGDASGELQLTAANTRAEDYVSTTDGTIEITLDKINIGAKTVFNPLVSITNNSENEVNLGLSLNGDTDIENYTSFMLDGDTGTNNVPADGTYTIGSGKSKDFGLKFDVPKGADAESIDMTLTITAEVGN